MSPPESRPDHAAAADVTSALDEFGTFPPCLTRISNNLARLSKGERQIANFVLRNPEQVVKLTIDELNRVLPVSKATVIRFCQKLGYAGYSDLRILLARDLGSPYTDTYADIDPGDSSQELVRKTFHISIRALLDSLYTLSADTLAHAGDAMMEATQVHLYGVGGSGAIAHMAQQRLARVGLRSYVCTDPHSLPLFIGMLQPGDMAVGISHSGNTEDIVRTMKQARQIGALTVGLTNYEASPLTTTCELVLLTGVGATPLASEAGASRMAQLAVVDALAVHIGLRQQKRIDGQPPSASETRARRRAKG